MKNIRLTTPQQKDGENPAVEMNPGNLERWLDALPVNDIIETIGRLDEAISAFNEVKVQPANRLKLLEIYNRAFHSILQGYDEMRIAQLKVPAKQKQHVANKILWLNIKLSHGYKILVKDYAGNPENAKLPKYLLLSVFRALELTVLSLLRSYRFGLDVPPLTYIELHQLYAFAESYGIADKAVKAVTGYARSPTISSYYALAMIFISLDPAKYESYTLEVLFLALQPFAFRCPIVSACESTEASYIYRINLAENRPPSLVTGANICAAREAIRYLDIESFISGINAWLEENKNNINSLLIEHELELFPTVLFKLKINKDEKNTRTSGVTQIVNQSVKLVIGFLPLESLLIMKSVDLGLRLNYSVSEWAVQSHSASGCELAGHVELISEEMSLGDLVAIVSEEEEGGAAVSLSKVAYISRLQQLDNGVLQIGLEYLAGSAYPLVYMIVSAEGKSLDSVQSNGIYLLDEEGRNNPPLMIVSRKHYQEEQCYLIKTREKVCMVKATKRIGQKLRYAFFQFRILHEEQYKSPDTINMFNIAV